MKFWRLPVLVVSALAAAGAAWAQEPQPLPQPTDPNAANDPWYHQQLLDLSEVLGGSHYLTTLCSGQGDQRWRDAMRSLIRRAPQYSDELVEAFNRGYGNQQRQFTDCDPSAQQTATELRARGLRISQALSARHDSGPSADPH
ncbi:MAG: TIGR02301 family protein [Terricaulis sp.]